MTMAMGKVIHLSDHDAREGPWIVGYARCACGKHGVFVAPKKCNHSRMECPGCHKRTFAMVGYDDWKESKHRSDRNGGKGADVLPFRRK